MATSHRPLQKKSRGLGDTIEKFTKATGIKTAVEKVAKAVGVDDCGCEKRKQQLNNPNILVNKLLYNTKNKK